MTFIYGTYFSPYRVCRSVYLVSTSCVVVMSVLVSWVRGGLLTGQDMEADQHHRWGYSQVPTGFGALCTWSPHLLWLWCQCWFPEWGEGYWWDMTWRLTNTTGGDIARSLQGLVLCVPGPHIFCGCDVSAGFLSEGRATDGTGHVGWPTPQVGI